MLKDIIKNAFKNLKRKKLRTFLTMLGIIIGISSVTTILSIGKSGEEAIMSEFDRFGLNGLTVKGVVDENGVKGQLDYKKMSLIKKSVNDVTQIMPVIYYYGNVTTNAGNKECMVWGIGDNAKKVISQTTIYGNNISKSDIMTSSNVCIIDNVLSKKLFNKENSVGMELKVLVNGVAIKLKVKGVVNVKESILMNTAGDYIPSFIYMPYTTIEDNLKVKEFDQLVINVKDGKDLDTVGNKIISLLSATTNTQNGYYVENMVKQKQKIENIINIVTGIVSAVAGVSLVVGGLGIMTIMLAAVTERKREIGIKKAVGATKWHILSEILAESVMITLMGAVVGLVLSAVIVGAANVFLGFESKINIIIMLLSLIFSAFVGIIFSVYPAKKASELLPINALRNE
ncbi:MAG: FtsX-like permease family protein [Ruminococcaceae bacterium]|nr:FtsX-like permease family protein [Oscillospiraceae bacterium]